MLTFGSLFAGIGGFDLGLERAGMQCKWQVEIDPYCQRVLAKHWPDVARYGDIKECGKHNLEPVDLICGGFPCQPFSVAGKRGGKADDRYLWPEMLRVIREVRPRWVLGENVAGIIHMELDTVLADLEAEGYEIQTFVIPACGVDAPHRRDRVWIVAHSLRTGPSSEQVRRQNQRTRADNSISASSQDVADTAGAGLQEWGGSPLGEPGPQQEFERCGSSQREPAYWLPEPGMGRVAHGVPKRVDRLKCLGNSVVPQVVEVIGRAIMEAEEVTE